jgi:hypothetical protein
MPDELFSVLYRKDSMQASEADEDAHDDCAEEDGAEDDDDEATTQAMEKGMPSESEGDEGVGSKMPAKKRKRIPKKSTEGAMDMSKYEDLKTMRAQA